MPPADNGMLKTTVVCVTAAESEDNNRTLTRLGEWQAQRFGAELVRVGNFSFDRILVAAGEADSWLTANKICEEVGGTPGSFLKELALPDPSHPRGAEIARLIKRHPSSALVSYAGEPEYPALTSQISRALREIRPFVEPQRHQKILICSRHGHMLSALALHWVSEMVFAGFKILSHVAAPVGRTEVCFAANEYFLDHAQGLRLRFDASEQTEYTVAPIEFITAMT